MGKCVHCGGVGRITKKYIVVEYLSQIFNTSTGTRTDRKEKIHGTLEGSICSACLKNELQQYLSPLNGVGVPVFLGGLLVFFGVPFIFAGLLVPVLGKTASVVGGILTVIGLSVSVPFYLKGQKINDRIKASSPEENEREFAGKFIAAGLKKQSCEKDWMKGEFKFIVDSLAGYDMRSTQYAIHFIELDPSLATAKQFSLVQKYGISEKMENELKVMVTKML